MPASSTISSKGQVTVPIEVRHRLGLREGDRVEFVFEDGRTVLRPGRQETNPFDAYLGASRRSTPAKKSTRGFAIFAMRIHGTPNPANRMASENGDRFECHFRDMVRRAIRKETR